MANFENLTFKSSGVGQAKKESGLNEYASSLFDQTLTWEDVAWLKSVSTLPLVLKGILTGICCMPYVWRVMVSLGNTLANPQCQVWRVQQNLNAKQATREGFLQEDREKP